MLSLGPPPGRQLEPLDLLLPRRSICILSDEARCAASRVAPQAACGAGRGRAGA